MDGRVLIADPEGVVGPALARAGVDLTDGGAPSLVVIDVVADPTAVARLRRVHPGVPVLGIVDEGVASDVRVLLDDYLLTPWTPTQLAARVRFHLATAARGGVLALTDRSVDLSTGAVTGGEGLTWLELEILRYLAGHAGRAVPREELEEAVWKGDPTTESSRVYVGIRRLREKVERDPKRPRHVLTVRGEGYRFEGASAPPTPQAAVTPGPSRVPQPTQRYVDAGHPKAVLRALNEAAMVALVGPVGAGKTRLAQEVALGWRGPAWWIDATSCDTGEAILGRLSELLGVVSAGPHGVGEPLRAAGHGLVVLDGVDALGGDLDAIFAASRVSPETRWLLTSNRRVDGVVPVDVTGLTAEAARTLLLARAAEAGGGVDPADPAVDQLVAALDHLPLAIEVAAARLGVLTPRQLLGQLDAVLKDDALEQAIDWALSLRTEVERGVLAQLGVFAGGFDLPGAEAVVVLPEAGDTWLPDVLQGLVSASLVHRRSEAGAVFLALYEPVRHRARRALEGTPDPAAARRRLRDHVLSMADALVAQVDGGDRALRARVDLHRDDLLAVFRDLRSEDPATAARLIQALVRGSREVYRPGSTIRRLLDELAAASDELPDVEAVAVRVARAKVLEYGGGSSRADAELAQARRRGSSPAHTLHMAVASGVITALRGRYAEARAHNAEARALALELGDEASWLEAVRGLAGAEHGLGNLEASLALSEEALAAVEAKGDLWRASAIRDNLAKTLADLGRLDEARSLLHSALAGVRQVAGRGREDSGEAVVLAHLGVVERDAGRPAEAVALFDEALPILADPWNRIWQARIQAARAWAHLRLGRPRAAWADAEAATQPVPGRAAVEPRVVLAACELARGRRRGASEAVARARQLAQGLDDPREADRVALGEALLGADPTPLLRSRSSGVRAFASWLRDGHLG